MIKQVAQVKVTFTNGEELIVSNEEAHIQYRERENNDATETQKGSSSNYVHGQAFKSCEVFWRTPPASPRS